MQGIIMTAYKDYDHLKNLLYALNRNFFIFLHIDRKSVQLYHRIKQLNLDNVKVYSVYNVSWGGMGHLLAVIHLLREVNNNSSISYVHIISGQDYPVKSHIDFLKFENTTNIYMTCTDKSLFTSEILRRLECPVVSANIDSRNKLFKFVHRIKWGFLNIIRQKRTKLGDFSDIYKGMVWVSMPLEVCKYVVDYTDTHSEFMHDLNHTVIPEEFFFQTIIMNSIYKKNVVNDNLRYTDWNKRNGNIPAYLDETDIQKIWEKDAFFARKFDSNISKQLIEIINENTNFE